MSTATYSVRTMLLSFERRILLAGGQRGALANAHAAVLESIAPTDRCALRILYARRTGWPLSIAGAAASIS